MWLRRLDSANSGGRKRNLAIAMEGVTPKAATLRGDIFGPSPYLESNDDPYLSPVAVHITDMDLV